MDDLTKSPSNPSQSGVQHDFESQIEQLKRDVANVAETVRDKAGDQLQNAQEHVDDAVGDIEKRVRREPLKAVAIAAGVGLLIGALISR